MRRLLAESYGTGGEVPELTVTPARWYAHRTPGDPADVLLPVLRSPEGDPFDGIPGDTLRRRVPHDVPGNRPDAPLTVFLHREVDVSRWYDHGTKTLVAPVLRLSADAFALWERAVAEAREHSRYLAPTPGVLADLHSGVPWEIRVNPDRDLDGPPYLADPAESYEVRIPAPWGEVRHADTYALLDRLTGPAPRIGDSRRRHADAYPLSGWSVAGPFREARP